MTDAMGNFVGGGRRYLSPSEIQRMKKNMRKVPAIHEKGEKYHETETQEADSFIAAQLEKTSENAQHAVPISSPQNNLSSQGHRLKNIFLWIEHLLHKLYTLKQKQW